MIALIARAERYASRLAISASDGDFTYADLLAASARVAAGLLTTTDDLAGERVAYLVPPVFDYPAVQWGIWRAGGVAVPLCTSHPEPELQYVINDCEPRILVASQEMMPRLAPIARRLRIELRPADGLLRSEPRPLPAVVQSRPAMIIYTSGTTGGPKGVVTTHDNIAAQVASLVEAWEWREDDRILLVLPLHHVHGIINVLGCALFSGAAVDMLPRFDSEQVWERFASSPLTLFMAVPTIYSRLAASWELADSRTQQDWTRACGRLRLMVSGSAALPVRLFERWQEISGHTLLERYGMTEIGMALSNPLHGLRIPGHVGTPLPGIEVRRVDLKGRVTKQAEEPGEIEVRGPGVFREYWRRPVETEKAFREGWFRTGDVAVVENGSYRILGRQSVDIIKTGGYKVSALEVEESLRQHPAVSECAVVAVADPVWGERIAVAIELQLEAELSLETLRSWCKERLAPYKIPSLLELVDTRPRNPMGKVTTPEVKRLFET
jgi:malonyl-CoA/methylmalonyl-CoA synthetase